MWSAETVKKKGEKKRGVGDKQLWLWTWRVSFA